MASSPNIKLDYTVLDVFTKTPYEGNPLAIVELPSNINLSQEQKQLIAREFNFSETSFLHVDGHTASSTSESQHGGDRAASESRWRLDIFMTTAELPFAGHPTIGSACFALGRLAPKGPNDAPAVPGSFIIKAGSVDLSYDPRSLVASAEIPHNVRVHAKRQPASALARAQPGIELDALPETGAVVSIVKGMTFVLVQLRNTEDLGRVSLPHSLGDVPLDDGWESFVGTYFYVLLDGDSGSSNSGSQQQPVRVRTRMIADQLEDPATGSAASALASYLAMQGAAAPATVQYEITQGVEMGRKSVIGVSVTVNDRSEVTNVRLSGSAVEIMSGKIIVPPS